MVLARADSHRERTAEMTAAYYTGSRAKSHSNSLIWRVSMRDGVIGTQQQAEPHSLIIVHPLIITLHTLLFPPCLAFRDTDGAYLLGGGLSRAELNLPPRRSVNSGRSLA